MRLIFGLVFLLTIFNLVNCLDSLLSQSIELDKSKFILKKLFLEMIDKKKLYFVKNCVVNTVFYENIYIFFVNKKNFSEV